MLLRDVANLDLERHGGTYKRYPTPCESTATYPLTPTPTTSSAFWLPSSPRNGSEVVTAMDRGCDSTSSSNVSSCSPTRRTITRIRAWLRTPLSRVIPGTPDQGTASQSCPSRADSPALAWAAAAPPEAWRQHASRRNRLRRSISSGNTRQISPTPQQPCDSVTAAGQRSPCRLRKEGSAGSACTSTSRSRDGAQTPPPRCHQQQPRADGLPLIERNSGFTNLNDWFAEWRREESESKSAREAQEQNRHCFNAPDQEEGSEGDDECARTRRMHTDDPSFY
ncbi:hypothetical protein JKP88DRAFT_242616 [Tribonema minus]|uniref:Uncharacterized protein n=1 Tax=Tribonema minus TaxID=303371 RepID=A0A835ZIF3_9STRA|nr:hypothetical protein JKP88DRAFT_242616 [Tribonema minus]